jgi:hypothetical protein
MLNLSETYGTCRSLRIRSSRTCRSLRIRSSRTCWSLRIRSSRTCWSYLKHMELDEVWEWEVRELVEVWEWEVRELDEVWEWEVRELDELDEVWECEVRELDEVIWNIWNLSKFENVKYANLMKLSETYGTCRSLRMGSTRTWWSLRMWSTRTCWTYLKHMELDEVWEWEVRELDELIWNIWNLLKFENGKFANLMKFENGKYTNLKRITYHNIFWHWNMSIWNNNWSSSCSA